MSNEYTVTVIIPTVGETKRATSLLAAIHSIESQENVKALPLVVLNGKRYDESLRRQLEDMPNIRFVYQPEGSLPVALATGRSLVETPFFGFLDDDDEYLPSAIQHRVQVLQNNPDASVVATNGYKTNQSGRKVYYQDMKIFVDNPLLALLEKGNWLASCGGLYRTDEIGLSFFAVDQKYFEWTLTAFKLAIARKKIIFSPEYTFVVNDTEGSLSKSEQNYLHYHLFLLRLKSYLGADEVGHILDRRRYDALHDVAGYYLSQGDIAKARQFHRASLASWHSFWKYIAYSRKLLF